MANGTYDKWKSWYKQLKEYNDSLCMNRVNDPKKSTYRQK